VQDRIQNTHTQRDANANLFLSLGPFLQTVEEDEEDVWKTEIVKGQGKNVVGGEGEKKEEGGSLKYREVDGRERESARDALDVDEFDGGGVWGEEEAIGSRCGLRGTTPATPEGDPFEASKIELLSVSSGGEVSEEQEEDAQGLVLYARRNSASAHTAQDDDTHQKGARISPPLSPASPSVLFSSPPSPLPSAASPNSSVHFAKHAALMTHDPVVAGDERQLMWAYHEVEEEALEVMAVDVVELSIFENLGVEHSEEEVVTVTERCEYDGGGQEARQEDVMMHVVREMLERLVCGVVLEYGADRRDVEVCVELSSRQQGLVELLHADAVVAVEAPHEDAWYMQVSRSTGRTYYYNARSQASSWELPSNVSAAQLLHQQPQQEQPTPVATASLLHRDTMPAASRNLSGVSQQYAVLHVLQLLQQLQQQQQQHIVGLLTHHELEVLGSHLALHLSHSHQHPPPHLLSTNTSIYTKESPVAWPRLDPITEYDHDDALDSEMLVNICNKVQEEEEEGFVQEGGGNEHVYSICGVCVCVMSTLSAVCLLYQ